MKAEAKAIHTRARGTSTQDDREPGQGLAESPGPAVGRNQPAHTFIGPSPLVLRRCVSVLKAPVPGTLLQRP